MSTGVASAAPRSALIDGSTVSGGAGSQEGRILAAQGYAVTVVSDAAWGSMTQAQFGEYDLLVAGDPGCGGLPAGLVASAPVYGPVVLGRAGGRTSAGNRIVIGTDPVYHDAGNFSSPNARGTIIRTGLGFAGTQPGTTGMYFDSSCSGYQSAQNLAVLSSLSAGSGAWTINARPPCGGSVGLVASNPAFSDLTAASLQGWSCSVHETFPTFSSDWSALAVATDTASHPTCGATVCGEAYVLIAGSGVVVVSGSISVTPASATIPVGTDHTVTANVTSGGTVLSGKTVTFTVTGRNAGATGTCRPVGCVTDAAGNAAFTYRGGNTAGDDTIKASFTDARGSLQSATALAHFVGVVEQPISASGQPISATEGAAFGGSVATITDPDPSATPAEYSATINWGDGSSTTAGAVSGASGGPFDVGGSHTYPAAGTYTVTTTISDVDQASNGATATSSATVADAALTAGAVTFSGGSEGSSPTAASFGFTDANPAATVADFTATIKWGDGQSSPGAVAVSGPGFVVTGDHTYTEEGAYRASVTVGDVDGPSASATGDATVADAALTSGPLTVSAGTEGTQASGASMGFTDGNPGATVADFTATINWGDGQSSPGALAASGSGFVANASHTYAEEGNYPVSVTVNDTGGQSGSATGSAKVDDAALTATGRTINSTRSFNGTVVTFADADPHGTAADYTATIDWGDGTPATAGAIAGSFDVAGSHAYAQTGPYTVKVKVADAGGSTVDATTQLLIYAAAASNGGSFAIGDGNSAVGTQVVFWGSRWASDNSLSSGGAPSSFKGFADRPSGNPATCGDSYSTGPGNSSPPPETVPAYMAVFVSSSITKQGPRITGDIGHIVVVKTDHGYQANPGHPGTGAVVAVIC